MRSGVCIHDHQIILGRGGGGGVLFWGIQGVCIHDHLMILGCAGCVNLGVQGVRNSADQCGIVQNSAELLGIVQNSSE